MYIRGVEVIIWIGSSIIGGYLGGIFLGCFGALCVFLFVFGFQEKPGILPFDISLVILGTVVAVSTLQAAGGFDLVIKHAAKLLGRYPYPLILTILVPVVVWLTTVLSGTGYIAFALYPIINDVSLAAKCPPKRHLIVATIASMYGVLASPFSPSLNVMADLLKQHGYTGLNPGNLLAIVVPSTLLSLILTSLTLSPFDKKTEELAQQTKVLSLLTTNGDRPSRETREDVLHSLSQHASQKAPPPLLTEREKVYSPDGRIFPPPGSSRRRSEFTGSGAATAGMGSSCSSSDGNNLKSAVSDLAAFTSSGILVSGCDRALLSLVLFLVGVAAAATYLVASSWVVTPLAMFELTKCEALFLVMMSTSALMALVCEVTSEKVISSLIFKSGLVGCVCVLGVAWMGQTLLQALQAQPQLKAFIDRMLETHPWTLMITCYILASPLYGQSAAIKALMPPALSVQVSSITATIAYICCGTVWLLPMAPAFITVAALDKNISLGTYFLFDHSFFLPGLLNSLYTLLIATPLTVLLLH